jgi:hypothetical protein
MQNKLLRRSWLIGAVLVCGSRSATADVDLRVESRPNNAVIHAYARVTDAGQPVVDLTAQDFGFTLDGGAPGAFTFGLPPAQDPQQHISVVFVLSNGVHVPTVQAAVIDFIQGMAIGDHAAIVRTQYSADPDMNTIIVQPFTGIDGGSGTATLLDSVVISNRQGFPKLYESLMNALMQFPGTLPEGPKAVVVIGTGRTTTLGSTGSLSDVVALANELGVPVFTIESGDNSVAPEASALLQSLAADTGGVYFADGNIDEAYRTIQSLLTDAYRFTIAPEAVIDCDLHMLEVAVLAQVANEEFSRCDTTPELFGFGEQSGAPGSVVVSNAITLSSLEGPAEVLVWSGEYSVGCGSAFTSAPGYIFPNDAICVRNTTPTSVGDITTTTLSVGGVSGQFDSSATASQRPPPPPLSGGGGPAGVGELILLFGLMLVGRPRRRPHVQ